MLCAYKRCLNRVLLFWKLCHELNVCLFLQYTRNLVLEFLPESEYLVLCGFRFVNHMRKAFLEVVDPKDGFELLIHLTFFFLCL